MYGLDFLDIGGRRLDTLHHSIGIARLKTPQRLAQRIVQPFGSGKIVFDHFGVRLLFKKIEGPERPPFIATALLLQQAAQVLQNKRVIAIENMRYGHFR